MKWLLRIGVEVVIEAATEAEAGAEGIALRDKLAEGIGGTPVVLVIGQLVESND